MKASPCSSAVLGVLCGKVLNAFQNLNTENTEEPGRATEKCQTIYPKMSLTFSNSEESR
jgi:hypothetical protein